MLALSAIFQSLRKPSINIYIDTMLDETSKAQVMALVRYHLSQKQGTRILVNPYTQVRESRRKLAGTHSTTSLCSVSHASTVTSGGSPGISKTSGTCARSLLPASSTIAFNLIRWVERWLEPSFVDLVDHHHLWNRPATLVDGSYLTEDGRVVSNRQAASWARKKSATLRMKLSQGLMDLV